MKPLFPLLILVASCLIACQPERIAPVELAAEKATCHLTAQAKVEYRVAGFESESPFFYLVLLDKEGLSIQDVYAANIPREFQVVGTRLQLVYHESFHGDHAYISACGPDGEGNPVTDYIKAIVPCEMTLAPS